MMVDHMIGRVLAALDHHGMKENTLVFFHQIMVLYGINMIVNVFITLPLAPCGE